MPKEKRTDPLTLIRRVNRELQLERERKFGRPVSKTYGGKPTAEQDRRTWRKNRHDD